MKLFLFRNALDLGFVDLGIYLYLVDFIVLFVVYDVKTVC